MAQTDQKASSHSPAEPELTSVADVLPYTPTLSDVAFDPEKLIEREREIFENELRIFAAPPGVPLAGTGPEVSIGLDAEWVHDPVTQKNRILSIQFHLVGECGEFAYIHYLGGSHG